MIYLRSRLGRAMPAIGKGLPGPHSTSPGEPGDPVEPSQAATLDDFALGEFGDQNATCISLAATLRSR